MNDPRTQYMDVDEFSKELGTSTTAVYKLIRLRQLPVRKLFIGGRTEIFIPVEQALAVLERSRDAHVSIYS